MHRDAVWSCASRLRRVQELGGSSCRARAAAQPRSRRLVGSGPRAAARRGGSFGRRVPSRHVDAAKRSGRVSENHAPGWPPLRRRFGSPARSTPRRRRLLVPRTSSGATGRGTPTGRRPPRRCRALRPALGSQRTRRTTLRSLASGGSAAPSLALRIDDRPSARRRAACDIGGGSEGTYTERGRSLGPEQEVSDRPLAEGACPRSRAGAANPDEGDTDGHRVILAVLPHRAADTAQAPRARDTDESGKLPARCCPESGRDEKLASRPAIRKTPSWTSPRWSRQHRRRWPKPAWSGPDTRSSGQLPRGFGAFQLRSRHERELVVDPG